MNIRNIIVSLTFAAACHFGLSAQSVHKQELSTNFGLPSRQAEETLPASAASNITCRKKRYSLCHHWQSSPYRSGLCDKSA